MKQQDIKSIPHQELAALITDAGLPAFRTRQIEGWLFSKYVSSFDDMTNLPKALRNQLDSLFYIGMPRIALKQVSDDGTRKYLLKLHDGETVETVGIPSSDGTRLTVCFSTQAGCAMRCSFCATGLGGFTRNLHAGEMFDQVKAVEADFGQRITNIVAMGQGEPFANYEEALRGLRLMNSSNGLGIGARHITVSTCGIIPGIKQFTKEPEQFTLAISLHSAIQETRDVLMPGVREYRLEELKVAIKDYGDTTKRRPTLEYAPISDVNDDNESIEELIRFCHGMLCHVNLIPLNSVSDSSDPHLMKPSSRIDYMQDVLQDAGIEVSVRSSRGGDIDGACGQLRQKNISQVL